MNASSTPSAPIPYASRGPRGPAGLPWYRVLVRLVLVVVPAQVVGALVATLLVAGIDLVAHPGSAALFWVLPGLVAGVGVGLLLSAATVPPWGRVGLAAGVAAVSYLLLVLLGHARTGSSAALLTPSLLGGLLGCVAVQTVLCAGVLLLRRSRTRR